MKNKLKYNEVLPRVRAVNRTLFEAGFNLKEVFAFWKECNKEAQKHEIMAMFYDGFSDAEIAEKTGYGKTYIMQITAEGLNEKVTKQVVESTSGNI